MYAVVLAAALLCPSAVSQDVVFQDGSDVTTSWGRAVGGPELVAEMNGDETDGVGRASRGKSSSGSVAEATSFSSSSSALVVNSQTAAPAGLRRDTHSRPFSSIAAGIKVTSLGAGIEVATPLARSLNLRGGANFFDLGYPFSVNGADYTGEMHFRSGQMMVDWFPFHTSFHISPGILIYHSQLFATASVAAGNSFTLDDNVYISSVTDPVHGSANLSFGRTLMPSLTMGFGNLIPRSGRRWSIPFEVGAAYMGHNSVAFSLQGTACTQSGCESTGDATIQQNVNREQANMNEALKRLQVYPIVSTGFAWRF